VEQNDKAFSGLLLSWYQRHKRDLPWRHSKDPYKIWLSEIILQQTRVAQGLPYYRRFVERFPSIMSLAAASQEEVLALWQGLGYYSRARNMHACARQIVEDYGAVFPSSYDEIVKLKGVGPYTAAAVASFAFNEPVPVVDGNVYRVASRVFGIYTDISSSRARSDFETALNSQMPKSQAGLFNQAMMEFGALHCSPINPDCRGCVFNTLCHAYAAGEVNRLPVKSKKVTVKSRYFNYFVFRCADLLLLKVRREKDIWLGLHDFVCVESKELLLEEEALAEVGGMLDPRHWRLEEVSDVYRHVLTHRVIHARFYQIDVLSEERLLQLASLTESIPVEISAILSVSKPVLISNYLKSRFLLPN